MIYHVIAKQVVTCIITIVINIKDMNIKCSRYIDVFREIKIFIQLKTYIYAVKNIYSVAVAFYYFQG